MIVNISREIDDSKIRMGRARIKITQQELGRRTGLTREKINALENAKCRIVEYGLLEKIANVFGIQANELLKKEER